jgi:hypothetical protein
MVVVELQRPAGGRSDVARRAPEGDRRQACQANAGERSANLLCASPREGRTLEDALSGAWEELSAHRAAACLICDGTMMPRYGSGPFAVGGRCGDCGCELG